MARVAHKFQTFRTRNTKITQSLKTSILTENNTHPNMIMISTFSIFLLAWTKESFAYIVSSTSTSSAVITSPTFLPSPVTNKNDASQKRSKYDLGLGKNLPVTSRPQQSFQPHHDIHQAVKYWMVSDSTRSFPQPNSQLDRDTSGTPISMPTAKKLRPIIPSRFSHDAIHISQSEHEAQAVWTLHPNDVDVNTMWVEMLIHHEQMIHATA